MPNPITPPRSLCLLRLSAIGDSCHVVPVVRALQRTWPGTRLTWILGRAEARLMSLLPGVEFITIDKAAGWSAAAGLRRSLAGRRFDVLLHMQLSVRASLASLAVRAATRIGFDRPRARELQWLVTNARIPARGNEHVLDSFQGFLDALGVARGALEWNLPLPAEAQDYAAGLIPDGRATLVVSP
ncbi:MAG TPA: glycosyltransferase family 9 protein, partial [Steroidobacteraceae bacterium]|nr:glycosyltransferase family 9 protein [Steroidobacteraceae bacterium]